MAESHVISALVSKHSELQGQIEHHKTILNGLIDDLDSVSKTIRVFAPEYKLNLIKSKSVCDRYFARGELSSKILSCLKIKPSSISEITDYVFIGSNKTSAEIKAYKTNIYLAVRNMINRGIVVSFSKDGLTHYKITD